MILKTETEVSYLDFLRQDLLSRRKVYLLSQDAHSLMPADPIQSEAMLEEVSLEMMRLGFTMSPELINHFTSLSLGQFCMEAKSLISSLEDLKGDKNNFMTLHADFPKHGSSIAYQAKRVVSIINSLLAGERFALLSNDLRTIKLSCGCAFHPSMFDINKFSACPVCQTQVSEIGGSIEGKKQGTVDFAKNKNIVSLVEIGIAQESDAMVVCSNLLSAPTSITESDIELISRMVEYYKEQVICGIPASIPQKEQLCLIMGLLQKHVPERAGYLISNFKTATDALRLAVYLSGGDVSLVQTKGFRFKLTRSQRALVLFIFNGLKCNLALEDMMRRRGMFLRLGKYLHVGSEQKRYQNAAKIFYEIRNNHREIETFNRKKERLLSAIQDVKQQEKGFTPRTVDIVDYQDTSGLATIGDTISRSLHEQLKGLAKQLNVKITLPDSAGKLHQETKSESFAQLVALLATRPGEFSRWLDLILRQSSVLTKDSVELVLHHLSTDVLPKIKFAELLKLNAYFTTRDQKSGFRSFTPKGKVAKIQFIDGDNRNVIAADVIGRVSAALYTEVHNRLENKERLGSVYISPELKNIVLPLSMRSSSSAMTVYPRGSRVPVSSECGIARMYMYWKGCVDFDLSAVALDENWSSIASSSYCDYEDQKWAKFSGDIRNAPKGAAECIDIDIDVAREMGVRYVVMFVNIFTSGMFEDYNAFAGVMESKDDLVGEKFEPSAAINRLDLVGDAKGSVPLVFDIEKMEYIATDISISGMGDHDNSYTERSKLVQVTRAIEQEIRVKPTMFDLAIAHAVARADKIALSESDLLNEDGEPVEFDFKFDKDFALKLDDVMANWLAD
ncbi:hypothetical protein LMH73_002500 [Vibrio splendidus]|nr:hypothetical protein [Vibrio splendidus]MCC4880453.1 hypothetical protein [Vibrio splendidus]